MSAPAGSDAQRAAESLLAFWADGGVDAMLLDAPLDRIAAGRIVPPARVVPIVGAAQARPRAGTSSPDIAAAIAQAQALASGAADLDALCAAIAGFEGCPLSREGAATQAVIWRGDPTTPLLVIGEAPGAEEDAQGKPFVGRAGKLLDRMLGAARLTDRVMITNTVFWRPPDDRMPTPSEQAICAPFLERLIELVQPQVLLLVGGASAKALLKQDQGILALRGRWFDWHSADGAREIPALPTLHPAFLLRQPAAKKHAWSDLLTLTERLDRPDARH